MHYLVDTQTHKPNGHTMTHHNAHILTVALNPEGGYLVSLSRNGETNFPVACPSDAGLHRAIHSTTIDSFDADVPLLVVVAKARNRASEAETELVTFAKDCVRGATSVLPTTTMTSLAGETVEVTYRIYAPRVRALALPWAPPAVSDSLRVFLFTCDLSEGDDVLDLLPEARCTIAEAFSV